jgi:hypothetical protein
MDYSAIAFNIGIQKSIGGFTFSMPDAPSAETETPLRQGKYDQSGLSASPSAELYYRLCFDV